MGSPISLIFTIRDEEKTIGYLLDSIKSQTRAPDEIVIVDGGSRDKTIEIVKHYAAILPIRLIVAVGANIARGRNIAIRDTKYETIACTDGGCILDKEWLRRISDPIIRLDVDVVSGAYIPWYGTEFEEIVACMTFPELTRLKVDTFLPSSRSVAFKKKVWATIGGYPEWLETAEDTLFDLRLKKSHMKFVLAKDAIVQWKVRENFRLLFKQYFRYGKGDAQASLFWKYYIAKYLLLALVPLLTILFWSTNPVVPFLGAGVILSAISAKNIRRVKNASLKRILLAFAIASIIELAPLLGHFRGILSLFRKQVRVPD